MAYSAKAKLSLAATILLASTTGALAETALVAVSANFADAAETLSPIFTAATGHDVQLTHRIYRQALCPDR